VKQLGLTLVELISVLVITTLVTSMAIPSMVRIHTRSKATSGVNWIIGAVNFTRHAAINLRITTTICPSSGKELKCGGEWHDGVILFTDHNSDAILNGKDFLVERIRRESFDGTLKWRAFRNRKYLQMTPSGYTNYQNGNFVYCPKNRDLHFARQIVINVQGRARVLHSRNDAGIMTDRRGRPLRC
jgi:type IV fimbrial biogenesis protein FimT